MIMIIKGVTPAGSTQRYYIAGGSREEGRQENTKVVVKRKWWALAQPSYSPQGNGR